MSTSESKATTPPSGGDGASTQPDHVAAPAEPATTTTTAAPSAPDASASASATVADPGDPDEDDLDDLDDMLDDFAAVNVDPKKAPSAAAAAPKPAAATSKAAPTIPTLAGDVPVSELDGFADDDEFQKTLQAGMAELMGGLGDFENDPEIKAHFENMLKELGAGQGASASKDAPAAAAASAAPPSSSKEAAGGAGAGAAGLQGKSAEQLAADLSADATFQETIRRTMARMQASGDQATAAAAAEGSEDDFMAEMMKAMKDMPGGGAGSEEELSKMLMGMMNQLTNKEILYDPMRELNDKFPGWLEKNAPSLSDADKKRYEGQRQLVKEMVDKFEEPTYKDENVADREYIVERMQKMQESGSPPADLVGDMPSAKEVLDMPDDSCATQ